MRLGTPAVTSRGFGTQATAALGRLIIKTLSNIGDAAVEAQVRDEVSSLTSQHPVPGIDA